ncbi:MAG TPA: IS3 family transposase [Ktedonobacteraceae bacterium]|nr:IS3 family transposase [Ktedonobacteraceae bacterium]
MNLAGCPPYFFGSLKEECVGNQVYSSHEQARQALFEYLEIDKGGIRHLDM